MNKSVFNLSHERQLTAKADGTLYPIMCEATIPGGKYKIKTSCLARMTPLINPVYSRFDIYTHFFFVPNRIIWDNWEQFINPQDPINDTPPVFPLGKVALTGVTVDNEILQAKIQPGTLADHLGLQIDPTVVWSTSTQKEFSMLPFRAYYKIWWEHFRDTDLETETEGYLPCPTGDGYDNGYDSHILELMKKSWEKDYFTSARPYPQRGEASYVMTHTPTANMGMTWVKDSNVADAHGITVDSNGFMKAVGADVGGVGIETSASFYIEELREANAIQRLLEKSLKSGGHYWDYLRSFFQVKSRDERFQIPEFIGGGRQPVTISEVLQTSQSDTTPLGTYGGHGISAGNMNIGNFVAPEHGYIIGLMSIMPRATYVNQIRRDFFKTGRFDFYHPELANLGEQEVFDCEIKADPQHVDAFGYQERWAEHRFIPSTVHGAFRNDAVLKNFTAGRIGASAYALDTGFIHVTPDDQVTRIFATNDYDPFLISLYNEVTAVLPIPRHSNPSLL